MGSTDQATVPTPSDGFSLYSPAGTNYGAFPGVTNDYQPLKQFAYFSTTSETLHKSGEMNRGTFNQSTTGTTTTLASSDAAYSSTDRIINVTSGSTIIVDRDLRTSSSPVGMSFQYTGKTCAIENVSFYCPSGAGGNWGFMIFSGNRIDLTGYDDTNYNSHPQVVAHETQLFSTSSSSVGRIMTFSDHDGTGVMRQNGFYSLYLWALPGYSLSYYRWEDRFTITPVGMKFYDQTPSIINPPRTGWVNWYKEPGKTLMRISMEGSVSESTTYGASYGISPQSLSRAEQSFYGNQEVEIVSSLPGAPPWYGYSDGYTIYNTGDSTLYRWEAGTSSWQAI